MASYFNGLTLIVFTLILGSSGAYLVAREIAPFNFSFVPRSEIFERLTNEPVPVPPSTFGTNVALEICDQTMTRLSFYLAPTARMSAVANSCIETARTSISQMPSHSYGYYIEALARFALGEADMAVAALERSQAVGPNEQWLAERRVGVAETHYAALEAYAGTGHLADLALLAQSRRGIRSIAARYVANPEFRERVTAVVETLPDDIQQRFVAVVRAEARTMGAGA
jgi:hypothetical protein